MTEKHNGVFMHKKNSGNFSDSETPLEFLNKKSSGISSDVSGEAKKNSKDKKDFVPVYAERNKVGQVKVSLSEGSGGEADRKFEPKELDDELDKKKMPRVIREGGYLFEYNHKVVVVILINGTELQGKLHVGSDNFNVQLENVMTNSRMLIPKHSLLLLYEKVSG